MKPSEPKTVKQEQNLTELFRLFLHTIGEDPTREGLQETPARAARAWQEWLRGYQQDPADIFKTFDHRTGKAAEINADEANVDEPNVDEMVIVRDIPVYSHCEHHLAPFFGVAHIAYVPNERVIGLSKIPRLVQVFASRLQMQERLTNQIADTLMTGLEPHGVGVVVTCRHLCVESRGVRQSGTRTTTSALRGCLKTDQDRRREFMDLIK